MRITAAQRVSDGPESATLTDLGGLDHHASKNDSDLQMSLPVSGAHYEYPGKDIMVTPVSIPSWLSPPETFPSPKFEDLLSQLSVAQQQTLVSVIIHNCEDACFEFYLVNELHRTTHFPLRGGQRRKLFVRDDEQLIELPLDLSLQAWLIKLRYASRQGSPVFDSISADDFHDWDEWNLTSGDFLMIPSVKGPWGLIDIDIVGDVLLMAIKLCRLLRAWDPFGRLKALWKELHSWAMEDQVDVPLNLQRYQPPWATLLTVVRD
jgi:hypothetical protein